MVKDYKPLLQLFLLVIGFNLLLYTSSIFDAGWVVDDHINLRQHKSHGDILGEWTHPTYQHAGGNSGHIWRPIPATLQHIAALIFDRTPSVFRALNLGIHILNGLLLAFFLVKKNRSLAVFLVLFWLSHPMQTEVVCWSSDIYDLLMTSFLLLATLTIASSPMMGVLAFFLALLSKEVALAALPALLYLCWKERSPTTALGILLSAGLYLFLHQNITANHYTETMTEGNLLLQVESWLENLAWWIYIPAQAPFAHLSEQHDVLSIAFCLIGGLAIFGLWYQYPRQRYGIELSTLWWVGLLIPVGIGVSITGVHGFRYTYAPLTLLVASLHFSSTPSLPKGAWFLLALWVGNGSLQMVHRIPAWQSDMSLWQAEFQIEPDNPYVRINLGRQEFLEGHPEGILRWASAVEELDTQRQLLHRHREREALSKAAFLAGNYPISLQQTERLISELQATESLPPSNLWCILADNQEKLGLDFQKADGLCRQP